MNKRFSTLMAAALVAGGLSANAQNTLAKTGEFAYLQNGTADEYLVADQKGDLRLVGKVQTSIAAINGQLWKVKVNAPADQYGQPTYEFTTKTQVQALGIKLGSTSKSGSIGYGEAKIDGAGNTKWAYSDALGLYAVVGDSTYCLVNDGDLKVAAYKTKDGNASIADKIVNLVFNSLGDEFIPLDATMFNDLLTTKKLYFNNGKDVSSSETNLFKGKEWKAYPIQMNGYVYFALTDGTTKKGADNNNGTTEGKLNQIDKKNFVIVDSLFSDNAKMYHKLALDTIAWEPDATTGAWVAGSNKPANTVKRHSNTAAFAGKYYLKNDSIVLRAMMAPVKTQSGTDVWTKTNYANVAGWEDAMKKTSPIVSSEANKDAIAALDAAYAAWIGKKGTEELKVEETFAGAEAHANLIKAVTDLNIASAKAYAEALGATQVIAEFVDEEDAKFDEAATEAQFAAAKDELQSPADDDLIAALTTLKTNYNAWLADDDHSVKENDKFDADGNYTETLGKLTAKTGDCATLATQIGETVCTSAYEAAKDAEFEGEVKDESPVSVALNEGAIYTFAAKWIAMNSLYTAWAAEGVEHFDGVTFNAAKSEEAAYMNFAALKSDVPEVESYLTAVNGVVWNQTKSVAKYYADNADAEFTNDGQLALRKLSSATVLTIVNDGAITKDNLRGYTPPLVQPYETAPVGGGTADIDVTKVYYIKDLKVGTDEKNPNRGLFRDENPIAEKKNMLAEGQAFNPYSQFVVEKTPGTEKGSYAIYNRVTGQRLWAGIANQLSGDSITITYVNPTFGNDTIMLVDSKIAYTGKDAEKQIGYKAVSAFDLKNKAFKISSASPFMEDMYMHMKSDSTLKMTDGEVLYSLEAVVGTDRNADNYGMKVAGIDTLVRKPYYIKTAKNEYLVLDNNEYILSKDADKIYAYTTLNDDDHTLVSAVNTAFYFISYNADGNYVLVPAAVSGNNSHEEKALNDKCFNITINPYKKMLVNAQTGDIQMAKGANAKNDFFFVTAEEDPASLFTKPKHAQLKIANGDMIAVGKDNFAVAARVGDLKAGFEAEDFTMFLDTARYTDNEGKDLVIPSYYVTKGIAAPTKVAEGSRLYMWVANDSVKANPETYLYDTKKIRVQFRTAERYGVDSLIVANSAKNDTVSVVAQTGDAKKSNIYKTIDNFRFNILVDKDNEGSYVVRVNGGNQYLQNVNGVVVATEVKADAARISVVNADAPVGNESIDAATIKVVAGEGNVTVYGAAGKKVVVSDVLGRTTTVVATSDSQTVAVAAGVAIVAVEGEAAVKAVVK